MTITVSVGSSPFWCLFDGAGKPLSGGFMYAGSSNNPSLPKAIYSDPAATLPWPVVTLQGIPNVIAFNNNGEQGPFYFLSDSSITNDFYFLQIYDSSGNLVYSINSYFPASGTSGGGGGGSNGYFENYIVNNQFLRNVGNIAGPLAASTTVSPSAHSAFIMPDCMFIKNNATCTDQISFVTATGGLSSSFPGDSPPNVYFNYTCTVASGTETSKVLQFPINPNVVSFENQTITISFWAQHVSGGSTIQASLLQYFGDGGTPNAPVITNFPLNNFSSNSWTRFVQTIQMPSTSGKTIGTCGTDGIYFQLNLPINQTVSINIAKPCFYLAPTSAGINPILEAQTLDGSDSVIDLPRTGELSYGLGTFKPGWVENLNGTIGNSNSVGSRANVDTFFLFKILWDKFNGTMSEGALYYAIIDSLGSATTYGANAIADFNAGKSIALSLTLGASLVGAATNSTPSVISGVSGNVLTIGSSVTYYTGLPVMFTTTGSLPTGLAVNTVYYLILLTPTTASVATSFANAIAGTAITLSSAGSGTNTMLGNISGTDNGEYQHTLTINEMPSHNHPGSTTTPPSGARGGSAGGGISATSDNTGSLGLTIASQGGGATHNIVQPSTYYNVFMKL